MDPMTRLPFRSRREGHQLGVCEVGLGACGWGGERTAVNLAVGSDCGTDWELGEQCSRDLEIPSES